MNAPVRIRLPNRRRNETYGFSVNGLSYTASVSRGPENTVLELFLQNHKPGSTSDTYARDSAIAASLALQFGCPLSVLRRAVLRDAQGNASTPLGAALDLLDRVEEGAR